MNRKQNSNPKPFAEKSFSFKRLAILLLGVGLLAGVVWLLFKRFPADFCPLVLKLLPALMGCYFVYGAFTAIKTGSICTRYGIRSYNFDRQPVRFFALLLWTVLGGIYLIYIACII